MQKSAESIEQIRTRIRAQRGKIALQTAAEAAAAACQNLLQLPEFRAARHIAAYFAVNGEIETGPLIRAAWQQNKHTYLPILQTDGTLLFAAYTPHSLLRQNRYNISEPEINPDSPPLTACDLDILIAPLVAFDRRCQRVGMGAGYYDRTLADCDPGRPVRIGLAYEFQQVALIPNREWDVPMHKIVTENGVYSGTDELR